MENLPKALVGVYSPRWITSYPVDKAIRSLNNWDQSYNLATTDQLLTQFMTFSNAFYFVLHARKTFLRFFFISKGLVIHRQVKIVTDGTLASPNTAANYENELIERNV